MDLGLKDKIIIVSGGSEGIGGGISEALAEEGAIPVIATKSQEPTKLLLNRLQKEGKTAHAIFVDLNDTNNCQRVIDETINQFGKIDGLVNNAGINDGASLEKGPSPFRQSIQANLFHYFDLVHFAFPHLKVTKGSIVNISSKVALTGQGNTSGYAAAKAAQLGLTREWAVEMLPHGIRVNAILPAEVMTPLYRHWLDSSFSNPEAKETEIRSRIPLGKRMTTIQEIASTAVFLLSDKAGHTTGQFLSVDGGYVHLDRAIS